MSCIRCLNQCTRIGLCGKSPQTSLPKDFVMISDLQLRRDVLDELEFIPSVNAAHIAVSANCRVFNGSRSAIPSNAKQKSRMHMLRESIYSPSTPSPSLKSSLALRRE